MSDSIICERSFEFARRMLTLAEAMWNRGPAGRHFASQFMRCSTSIGSNADESQEGQTKPDFIAKLSISRKEAREACFWLRLALATEVVTRVDVEWARDEANQLLRMIGSAIITARSSSSRGEGDPTPRNRSRSN